MNNFKNPMEAVQRWKTRILNIKLPSRNQSIFYVSVGVISGLYIHDQRQIERRQKEFIEKAKKIAAEPASWNDVPRKVKVFMEPNYWPKYWFEEFVKPIFDAGALDYELVEPKNAALIIKEARNIVWDAKEAASEQDAAISYEQKYNNRGWFSSGLTTEEATILQKKFEDDAVKKFNPLLYHPKYNENIGLVAMGPIAWRHLIFGLQYGFNTDATKSRQFDDSRLEKSISLANINLPMVGYITSDIREGFTKFFTKRIAGWFTKRYIAQEIGEQAIQILYPSPKDFSLDHLNLGSQYFEPIAKKKEPKDIDLIHESWNAEAENISQLDDGFISKLKIY